MPIALAGNESVPIPRFGPNSWTSQGGGKSPGLLAHPERVAEEYQRRLQAPTSGTRQAQAPLETQMGKVRQGVARLMDS